MEPLAYTEFQPLKEVLVGRSYDTSFLEEIDVPFTPTTKRLMTHLLDETEEDYQGLVNTLKSLGVSVKRPAPSDYKKGFGHRLNGAYLMTPRDDQIVIDKKIIMGQYHTSLGQGFLPALSDYKKSFLPDPAFKNIVCSSIVRLGEDIIVDDDITAFGTPSDERMKENISPLVADDIIRSFMGFNVRQFTYKEDYQNHPSKEGPQIGFIAQEVEKILPEAVQTKDDGMKAINYDVLVAVLFSVIQELYIRAISMNTSLVKEKAQSSEETL